jgi:hypothetical protein
MKESIGIKNTRKELRKMLKPNTTIYTVTRHVSQSGMMRHISAFVIYKGKLVTLDWYIEKLDIAKRSKGGYGLVVNGCGMDMHFWLTYELGRMVYPKGFKLTKSMYGRNGDTSGYETDGGYAFRKESL